MTEYKIISQVYSYTMHKYKISRKVCSCTMSEYKILAQVYSYTVTEYKIRRKVYSYTMCKLSFCKKEWALAVYKTLFYRQDNLTIQSKYFFLHKEKRILLFKWRIRRKVKQNSPPSADQWHLWGCAEAPCVVTDAFGFTTRRHALSWMLLGLRRVAMCRRGCFWAYDGSRCVVTDANRRTERPQTQLARLD